MSSNNNNNNNNSNNNNATSLSSSNATTGMTGSSSSSGAGGGTGTGTGTLGGVPIGSGMTTTSDPKRPGAYSVTTESKGAPQFVQLKIPSNTEPGMTFQFTHGNRRNLTARCPPNASPGDFLQVAVLPEPITQYTSLGMATLTTVSEIPKGGAKPMMKNIRQANRELLESTADSFLVTIPSSIQPGQPFVAKTPSGQQQFLVTCPPNAGPGQSIRIRIKSQNNNNNSNSNNNNPNSNNNTNPTSRPNPSAQPSFMGLPNANTSHKNTNANSTNDNNSSNNNNNNRNDGNGNHSNSTVKLFQIIAPEGARPNQVLPVLVCGKRIPVTLPDNVRPGQKLKLKLPVQQVVGSIELSYDDYAASSGWCRTIRMSDFKFQWVNNTKPQQEQQENEEQEQQQKEETTNINQQQKYQSFWKHTALVRKLTFLEGNDPRLRTGALELVPAEDAICESELIYQNRTLLSYATVAHIQQQSLEDKTAWFHSSICSELMAPWETGRIKLVVRRSQLLSDSIASVMALSRQDMRKRWRIEFHGEPGIDSGGVMREWFHLITEQLFNPDLGLWLCSVNNQMAMTINPMSDISCPDDHLIYFRFLGRIMGRALFDRQLIQGHMVRHLYKHLLGWPITFDDLQAQDEDYYQSLKQFTTMNNNNNNVDDDDGIDHIAMLCLDFTISEDTMGVRKVIDLIPGGSQTEVTSQNLTQYLEAILRYRMLDRTKIQITELLLGFLDVIPEPALTVFDPNELELLMCGLPTIDMDDWMSNTLYLGLFEENDNDNDNNNDNNIDKRGHEHPVVQWFWEVVQNDFDAEMKARLLQFVTGTSGVPARGFSVLQGNDGNIKKFAIQGVERSEYSYPRAHTCFNRIDMPNYDTKEELYEKLKTAVTLSGVGFDIE